MHVGLPNVRNGSQAAPPQTTHCARLTTVRRSDLMRCVLLSLLVGMLSGCGASEPEIGRGLPSRYAEAEPLFDQRVKDRFPPGTDEKRLVGELKKQGFEVLPTHGDVNDATFKRGWIVQTLWSVRWRAKDNRVTEIWGVHGGRGP